MTWRELLSQYVQHAIDAANAGQSGWMRRWLADEGFSLDEVLPAWTGEDPAEAATAVLDAAHLVLVVDGDIVFLTSLDGLARQPVTCEANRQSVHRDRATRAVGCRAHADAASMVRCRVSCRSMRGLERRHTPVRRGQATGT